MMLPVPALRSSGWFAVALGLFCCLALRPAQAQDHKLKFEIYQDTAKEFRWRLKDGDKILATAGEGYKAKDTAHKGVERIQKDVDGAKLTFETYLDKAKETRWRLKVPNGQVIATSNGGYKDKADAEQAIAIIKKGAPAAEVVDVKP